MHLSIFYSALILFIFLLIADSTEFGTQCPTSRRLLLFKGFDPPNSGKKSHRSSSTIKALPSSPPKYARSSDSHGLTVFIQPQTSTELGRKARSYSHLLKSKLYTDEEKTRLKRVRLEKKNDLKKKTSSAVVRTQELIPINNNELNRCKALLHVDSTANDEKKTKKSQKDPSNKEELSSKVKNLTRQTTKTIKNKITPTVINSPTNDDKKVKISKGNSKANTVEKKSTKLFPSSTTQTNPNRPSTSPVKHIPTKSSPPSSQSTSNTKPKRTKPETITIIQHTTIPFDTDEIDEKNNSVVGRAFHFVKNMFQLSDNLFDENQAEEGPIIDITRNQHHHHHHHSRKLLSIDENDATTVVTNEADVDLSLNNERSIGMCDDSSFVLTSISKRQLLSVKGSKPSTSSKTANSKEKKQKTLARTDTNKPKVGWAYRYRISRYLNAQKTQRTGKKNKPNGAGKSKAKHKKTTPLATKISKRKLLQYPNDDHSNWNRNEVSDHDLVQSVSITARFLPKRQLFTSRTKEESDEDDHEKKTTRRRKKSFEELTDPIAIVQSYDRGLHKPRVGWQFRYRISRYIDSLRENIREDQERLKLGLQAIKRKTPQELSGRRKRVLDKPFIPDDQLKKKEETSIGEEDDKPNAGWRYRYRISKMAEAKKRGEYVDEEAEKRQARLEQKKKSSGVSKPSIKVEERIEGQEDLDPELRKINDEGRRVGWTYRYRIRRKLNYLKQQQTETGIPFDLATLSGKREKKGLESKVKSTEKKTIEPGEEKPQDKTKSAGWEYRYRISKMHEAQKHEKPKAPASKKPDKKVTHEQVQPETAQEKSEDRVAGWQYRYRIRRKLDAQTEAATRQNESGKRTKKSSTSKRKEKIIKQVEESIEQILNIDDIDETPFMEYFRRTSSYVLFGLLPTAKKSLCLLPLPVEFSFCDQENEQPMSSTKEEEKEVPLRKLKTKKEHRAKQFIHSHRTKFGAKDKATERRVDVAMKELYKKPSLPPPQIPPAPPKNNKTQKKAHTHSPRRTKDHELITKKVGVISKRNENKKQHQIIGQEKNVKPKHSSPPSAVTTPPPIVEVPETTAAPPPPPLRSIAEIIQAEAATVLAPRRKSSRTPEEVQAEIDETNESIQEQKELQTSTPTLIDSTTSGEEDNESTASSDNDNGRNPGNAGDNKLGLEKEKTSS